MEIRRSSGAGTLNEYIPEGHFCATPDGRGNENICPDDEATSPVVVSKRSRKDGELNLRKSLAWNSAFFTEEGVLDSSELPIITDSIRKPSSKVLSMTKVESSSMMQFDKFSKRPPLKNLEEVFLSKEFARPMSRRSDKRANNLFSISEASNQDGTHMPMTSRKTLSAKGIRRNALKLDAAGLKLEKEKRAKVQIENYTSIFKLNSCPSSLINSQREMSCSTPTSMTSSVKEKAQTFHRLPPTPIQAKQSTLRMPSSYGRLKKEKTTIPLSEKDTILLKLKSCPSASTKSPMETTCSGSAGIFSSISQQTFHVPGFPSQPIQAKPSALRMPSPSLGFFQQISSKPLNEGSKMIGRLTHFNGFESTSCSSPCYVGSIRTEICPTSSKKHFPQSLDESISKPLSLHAPLMNGEHAMRKGAEDETYAETNLEMLQCISAVSSASGKTSLYIEPRNDTRNAEECFHKAISQVQQTISGKSQNGEMHANSLQDVQLLAPEECQPHEYLQVCETCADTSLENLQCISAVSGASGEASLNIEPRSDPTEDGGAQNAEKHFHNTISQVQPTISGKSHAGEMLANSSQAVQLSEPEESQPHEDLQLCEPMNGTSLVEENGLMPTRRIHLENLKQDTVLLKHHLSAVPYSDEWLAAIEAFGEDILEVKTGTVHNSPPDKDVPEPGPWSPVKRKAQHVGPFDCTKYSVKSFPCDE